MKKASKVSKFDSELAVPNIQILSHVMSYLMIVRSAQISIISKKTYVCVLWGCVDFVGFVDLCWICGFLWVEITYHVFISWTISIVH